MSYGETEQIEKIKMSSGRGKSRSGTERFLKKSKNRVERRRAKQNPECTPQYNRYAGWQY